MLWCRVGDTTNFRQLSGRTLPSERHPDPVEAAIRLAIRNIRYQPPKGPSKIVEISRILDLRTYPGSLGEAVFVAPESGVEGVFEACEGVDVAPAFAVADFAEGCGA